MIKIYIYPTAALLVTMLFIQGCGRIIPPELLTNEPTAITQTTATSGGQIIAEGSGTISSTGVCWSTNLQPTVSDQMIESDFSYKYFICNLTGLTPNTTYNLRAFATFDDGTAYGNTVSFVTGPATVTDVDGNSYNVITIGRQLWMAENLKVTHYRNGNAIDYPGSGEPAWQANTTGGYSWYDNDEQTYKDAYGALYNWYAVMNTAGLCPAGWHVPSKGEWSVLFKFLDVDANPNNYPESQIAGGKLKSSRIVPAPHPRWDEPNTGATNDVGFSAFPGGSRFYGSYDGIGQVARWWTASEIISTSAWDVHLSFGHTWAMKNNYLKNGGFSVRCIKD